MELEKKVMELLKDAMRSKDEAALRTLRAIKGAIINAKTEKNAGEMDADKELQLIQKLAKQRKESFDIYTKQNMPDLAIKEKEELDVLAQFLPKQLSEEEIKPLIEKLLAEMGITDAKEMGKAIGAANKQLTGQADGSLISKIVKDILSIS